MKNKILRVAGITSIGGMVTFLALIFVTKAGFSDWKEAYYQPRNISQDILINENRNNIISNKDLLMRIDRNQIKILSILINKK